MATITAAAQTKQKRKRTQSKEQEEKTLQKLVKKHTKKRKTNKTLEQRLPKNLELNFKETHGGLFMIQMLEFCHLPFPKDVMLITIDYLQESPHLEDFLNSPYFTFDITKKTGDSMAMYHVRRKWRDYLYGVKNCLDRPNQSVSKGPFALHSKENKKILKKHGLDCTAWRITGLVHKNQPTLLQHFF
jgi:hypothetical protein